MRNHVQTYKCKACGKQFKGGERRDKNQVITDYVEGKTSTGGSALSIRLSDGAKQSDRIALNFIGLPQTSKITDLIKNVFFQNQNLIELIIFKKGRLIIIKKKDCFAKNFEKAFKRIWGSKK